MKRIIQSYLLKIYAVIEWTGILTIPWVRSLFTKAYELYKVVLEAGEIQSLQNYVNPGEVVVDIGANVGFFTKRFASWVSAGGFVVAVEPETTNFTQLINNINKSGISDTVRTFQGVAAEESGTLMLAINPIHPGDHKIGVEGVEVKAYTIDELVKKENIEKVCLMKIDVQGAEERVLLGAKEMILRDHPAIFIELDDEALKKMGSSAHKVVDWLTMRNYKITRLEKGAVAQTVSVNEALDLCRDGLYTDLLFV